MTTMLKTGWALAAAVCLAASGCGGNGDDESAGSPGRPGSDRDSSELRGLCGEGKPRRSELRDEFREGRLLPGVKGVRLVVDRAVVRPGERFHAVVANRSGREVTHGVSYRLERRTADGWEKVAGTPDAFILIALVTRPGALGPCVALEVPERAKPGRYRVLVGSAVQPGAGRDEGLLAKFAVRG